MRRIPLALLFLPLSAIAQIKPDLSITFLRSFERIGRGETRTMRFMVGTAGAVLHDVRVTLSVANGGTISVTPPSGFTCSEGVCTAPAFGPQPGTFDLQLVAPDREGGDRVVLHVVGTSSDEGEQRGNENYVFNIQVVRLYRVTTDADSGEGSLRQAIADANRACVGAPCRIIFDLPAPATIHPESGLPPINGRVDIDGDDRVTLVGDGQASGDGLAVDFACEVLIEGLTIDGFRGNGITFGSSTANCPGAVYPPLFAFGNTITGNFRGIVGGAASGVWISGNVIGGNRRSAIYLFGPGQAHIDGNFIGLTRDGAALPNGASGIYLDFFSASVEKNVIANNDHFGIAVSAFSPSIHMRENLIYANGQTAIDYGLDLETPNGDDGGGTDVRRPMLNHPVLIDAHYDAATNKTMVRGHYESKRATTDVVIEFFASPSLSVTGHAEARQFLGKLKIFSQHDYEFAFDGDLTSQWIAATATFEDSLSIVRDATSELSGPIRVSP